MSVNSVATHSPSYYQAIRNQNQIKAAQKVAQKDADGDNDGSTGGQADNDSSKGALVDKLG